MFGGLIGGAAREAREQAKQSKARRFYLKTLLHWVNRDRNERLSDEQLARRLDNRTWRTRILSKGRDTRVASAY